MTGRVTRTRFLGGLLVGLVSLAVVACATASRSGGDPTGTYRFDASGTERSFTGSMTLQRGPEAWRAYLSFDGIGDVEVIRVVVDGAAVRVTAATPVGSFRVQATHQPGELTGRWSLGRSDGPFHAKTQ